MTDCIFCNIAGGRIKADVVYEDASVVAFRDIDPKAPVHILIIPKKHIQRFSSLTESDASVLLDIHRAVGKLADIDTRIKDGFRLITNDGKNGGQTVGHLHFHLLGGRQMTWPAG
jgi:histidine triad (HIT) family protein